ncbi:MAG: sugar phosphate isomerase/epimerase [Firmicutes bacterium]|nr:sugar phosphate isomerase/epimerase [Bacillota bacterium]
MDKDHGKLAWANPLCVSTLTFIPFDQGREEMIRYTLEGIEAAATAGFTGLETWVLPFSQSEEYRRVADQARTFGLSIQSAHLHKRLLREEISTALEWLKWSLDFCLLLDLRATVLHPPYAPFGEALGYTRQFLEGALPLAKERKIIITLENVPFQPPGFLEAIARDFPSPWLGFTVDTEFAFVRRVPLSRYWEKLGERVVNCHLKDSNGRVGGKTGERPYYGFGEGGIDFAGVGESLHRASYQGPVVVETPFHLQEQLLPQLKKARRFVEGFLGNGP